MNVQNANAQTSRRSNPLFAGTAMSVMLVGVLGVAALMGLLPGMPAQRSASAVPGAPVANAGSATCANCGTVEAIRALEVARSAARDDAVLRAVTGGSAPVHEAEKNTKAYQVYRVTVRMDDGSFRTVSQALPPSFVVGDKVRVQQGGLLAATF
jgi:outer membrane lipoprotein SlyB